MTRSAKQKQGFGSLFEEAYLVRTLGRIARDSKVALTELVANAWDAGASQVDIAIPPAKGANLVVRDNGHGLTPAQFKVRWVTLGYDRVKNQGEDVEFPPERKDLRRRAYGRNGVGRHELLCFGDFYSVETWRGGKGCTFEIGTQSRKTPFRIGTEASFIRRGSGTILSVSVAKHLPDPDAIRHILSARFLHDPQFVVRVNGQSVSLANQSGLIERRALEIPGCGSAEAFVVDSTLGARPRRSTPAPARAGISTPTCRRRRRPSARTSAFCFWIARRGSGFSCFFDSLAWRSRIDSKAVLWRPPKLNGAMR